MRATYKWYSEDGAKMGTIFSESLNKEKQGVLLFRKSYANFSSNVFNISLWGLVASDDTNYYNFLN